MVCLAVIADDITGANDTGVQFKKAGFNTIIAVNDKYIEEVIDRADVVVINTDSRTDPQEVAYKKVRTVAKIIKKAGIKTIYKKIDSTLRGNIGAELDAIMDELKIETCIVAPAFPANGRITIGGYQLVNQIPISESEFGYDPLNPIKESHVPTLLQRQTRRKVGHVELSYVERGTEPLAHEFLNQQKKGNEIIVVDATTLYHLRRIAKAALISKMSDLTCGSAGLAEALSYEIKLIDRCPVLVVSGSVNEVTRRQILKAEQALDVQVIDVDPRKIFGDSKSKQKEIKKIVERAINALKNGKNLIIASARRPEFILKAETRTDISQVAEAISSTLGEITAKIVDRLKVGGLVLTGGSTAQKVCLTLGAKGIWIKDEVLPGIPLGKLADGKYKGLNVITKAGGFGDENAIINAIRYLESRT